MTQDELDKSFCEFLRREKKLQQSWSVTKDKYDKMVTRVNNVLTGFKNYFELVGTGTRQLPNFQDWVSQEELQEVFDASQEIEKELKKVRQHLKPFRQTEV